MTEIIGQGAEAIIYKEKNSVVKARPVKNYRLSIIDKKLRKSRTKREVKVLSKAKDARVPVPSVSEFSDSSMNIKMDFIEGPKLRDVLHENKELAKQVGKNVGLLHKNDIIHFDLTTSNMLLHKDLVYFIDFGLSFISLKLEDKAVDLHLFNRALESKHYDIHKDCWGMFVQGYNETNPSAEDVLARLEVVEKRGRNKKKSNS